MYSLPLPRVDGPFAPEVWQSFLPKTPDRTSNQRDTAFNAPTGKRNDGPKKVRGQPPVKVSTEPATKTHALGQLTSPTGRRLHAKRPKTSGPLTWGAMLGPSMKAHKSTAQIKEAQKHPHKQIRWPRREAQGPRAQEVSHHPSGQEAKKPRRISQTFGDCSLPLRPRACKRTHSRPRTARPWPGMPTSLFRQFAKKAATTAVAHQQSMLSQIGRDPILVPTLAF
ncbi:hypothetical protein Nepgr_030368 [Nepenthes gracilis]|uniref:Uncharacterized protein n=1 Tax=Nepenthes gracilis TaxID=150966 RepID=A0AAD3TF69_NEPGR|nr:hypothetical protein Nepgr_030368 [Nepenthes gracilis]